MTRTAEAMAGELGYSEPKLRLLRRAALLHDVGKLGVPNTILDKPGALTPQERATICEHPLMTRTILERISSFGELAKVAGEHHEKLDGSGYPLGLKAEQLCESSRLLTVADCFSALSEDRPYRRPMSSSKVFAILREQSPHQLDAGCLDVLESFTRRNEDRVASWFAHEAPASCALPSSILGTQLLFQNEAAIAV